MTQDQAWAAIELQEMWLVAQPLEAKVSGVATTTVAEMLQPQMGALAHPPRDMPAWHTPPNLPASCMLAG